jgi:8-oxo-dGTP pyrophosphatase MutT (NUDIX family)
MEKRDLYDEMRNPIFKTIKKGEKPPIGLYYVTVVTVMQDTSGKFLIQKRSKQKGGLWATTGGHPKSGETSKQGIITEVKEEMGIDISKENIVLFQTEKTSDDFVDYYYVKMPLENKKVTLQVEEVEDYAFKTQEEILKMIDQGLFHPKHAFMMKECFKFLEKRNS